MHCWRYMWHARRGRHSALLCTTTTAAAASCATTRCATSSGVSLLVHRWHTRTGGGDGSSCAAHATWQDSLDRLLLLLRKVKVACTCGKSCCPPPLPLMFG